ncbi:MAG: ABC transporter permease [Ferruginibacter sp.]
MLKNYFKIAWRNLLKHKVYSFINIIGLTIGITSFLMIALFVFDELTFDRFHNNSHNIYRVVEDRTTPDGKQMKIAMVSYQVSEKSKTDFPEIKDAVRIARFGRVNVSNTENTNVFYEDYMVCNQSFLTVFDFPLLKGNRKTALTESHSVILTEETAKKIFNSTNVIGNTILVSDRDSLPFKITGVLKAFPANSHLSFNLLFSESSLTSAGFKKFLNADWTSSTFSTYLVLDPNTDNHKLEKKIAKLVALNQDQHNKLKSSFILQPLKDIHFYSNDIEGHTGGNISYIYIFSIIGIFVLLIACINYINLTTARFVNRAKEIAVKKVVGASRENLIGQFLSESFVMTVISLVFTLIMVKYLLPFFNAFTEKELVLGVGTDYRIWIGILSILVIVTMLSGIYPALFQSGLKPYQLFKSKKSTGNGTLSIRRPLVVFQFSLSIIMIVATIVVYMQMKYINTKDMGFKKDQMVVIDINSGKVRRDAETIKAEFGKLSHVRDATVSSRVPGEWKNIPKVSVKASRALSPKGSEIYFLGVDDRFLKAFGIHLLKGRNFDASNPADSSAIIINEKAAIELGIKEPTEQLIEIPSADFDGEIETLDRPYMVRVIGIVKDFNFKSLREMVEPMALGHTNNPIQSIDYFTVNVGTGNIAANLTQMDEILHSVDPKHLFEYHFLDKQWELFYRQDQVRQIIFLMAAILTILIACLGLFGLATYTAEQRIKEIGIRKVLGASVSGIVRLLSKEFLQLVVIAVLIATPIAWGLMYKWLESFAYRINISWWMFVLAALVAIMIALCTVSFQAIKAAIANPVKSLRTE